MALAANPLDSLLSDLRIVSNESKRKFPPLKEAAEAAIMKVRTLSSKNNRNIDTRQALFEESARILEPFIMGCEFKQNQKVVQISLNAIQRMITHQAVSPVAACKLVDCLWSLMENNLEEVKVLQTATLLLSTNNVVSGPVLARTIVLCFRLHNIEKTIVASIASATIRQLVSNVFERVENEDAVQQSFDSDEESDHITTLTYDYNNPHHPHHHQRRKDCDSVNYNELKNFISGHLVNLANALRMQYAPRSLKTSAADAFLLLRDLVLILNDEPALWLVGLTDISKVFALELLEIAFVSFSDVLARHEEFRFLIKERICYMILAMFSADIKDYNAKNQLMKQNQTTTSTRIMNNETFHQHQSTTPHQQQELEASALVSRHNQSQQQQSTKESINNQTISCLGGINSDIEFISVVADMKCAIENNRPISPNSMRILRILSMLIQKFYIELMTSGDIFTAIFTKLLENDSNLKQISGPLKMTRLSSADTGTAGTTISNVASSDIPVVTTMISKLFENSPLLKRKHLRNVVEDLCKLNTSPYVITKLLELGLVNLERIGCIWEPLTEHLLNISRNPHMEIRDWGACALTHIIKQAFSYNGGVGPSNKQQQNQEPEGKEEKSSLENSNNKNNDDDDYDDDPDQTGWAMNQRKLLYPLHCLSQIPHPDIRQKQLDVVLQAIQSATTEFTLAGWPHIIDIVGTVEDWQTDNLIRIAFQCLQVIVSDYVSQIDCECVILIIAAIVKFACQMHDLNVSLTAIGLLWNVADYLHQNKKLIQESKVSKQDNFVNEHDAPNLAPFIYDYVKQADLELYESIWMALFAKLLDICIDSRPAIRKSACQTLFATITTHGEMLDQRAWHCIIWQILFPLLHQVRTRSSIAVDVSPRQIAPSSLSSMYAESLSGGIGGGGTDEVDSLNSGCESLVLHHSRNTAQKQWAETQVLALTGVTKVFIVKRERLIKMENFSKAWDVLVDFIRVGTISKLFEVSMASLKCMQDLLSIEPVAKSYGSTTKDTNIMNASSQTARTAGEALALSSDNAICYTLDVTSWLNIWVMPLINLLTLCEESMVPELKEDFARCCFEALYQYSLFTKMGLDQHNDNFGKDSEILGRLSLDCLTNRFMEVIIKYSHDERLAGKCPLPRHRMSEVIFVLRAMTTLLKSLKKLPSPVTGTHVWNQVLAVYPHLIDFSTRNAPANDQIKRDALNEVLLEYGSLLRPPPPPPLQPLAQPLNELAKTATYSSDDI